jgi:hypothetical protein
LKNASILAGASIKHACETLEEVADQLRLQIADPRRPDFGLNHGHRTTAKVHGRQTESFVHGHQKIAGSQDAAPVAESAVEGLTQTDSDILHGVASVVQRVLLQDRAK